MSDREERLRSLLDKVRAKRPDEPAPHAADALERIRTASGTMSATSQPSIPAPAAPPQPTPVPSAYPTRAPSSPLPDPPAAAIIDSPTRYSSQPPTVERPLSVEPRARSNEPPASAPAASPSATRPEAIRPQSVAPSGQPVIYATDQPEFVRPKTFGDLLELTLSLRPR